jgi:hypothetical protein
LRTNQKANGSAKPSFISHLLDEYERTNKIDQDHEEDIKAVGGVLYGGVSAFHSQIRD